MTITDERPVTAPRTLRAVPDEPEQQLPAACRLEDAQCPVLPVTLGCDYPGINSLKSVLVPVERCEDPRSQHVGEPSVRVALAVKLAAFGA